MAIADPAKLASSKSGMVTSPHPLASEIGAKILARGGNAVEATIAMHFALSVVYPHFTGIGGDAFLLFVSFDLDGHVRHQARSDQLWLSLNRSRAWVDHRWATRLGTA